jgi:uncharacterized protein YndB with AHSA1/START domain
MRITSKLTTAVIAAATTAFAAPVHAEVIASGPTGFVIRHEATLPVEQERAYAHFLLIQNWWDRDHTYSGDAANLSITPTAGGCWCERMPNDGVVEHMRATMISPGSMIRFSGGLGPLAGMGAQGAMTWTFTPSENGVSTVRLDYVVTGFAAAEAGLAVMAGPVDRVLGEAIANLAGYVRNLEATHESQRA